jgi:hypothetical protein
MASISTIPPTCLVKIPFDVCWLRLTYLNTLLTEVCEEMAGYVDAPARGPRSVSFLF